MNAIYPLPAQSTQRAAILETVYELARFSAPSSSSWDCRGMIHPPTHWFGTSKVAETMAQRIYVGPLGSIDKIYFTGRIYLNGNFRIPEHLHFPSMTIPKMPENMLRQKPCATVDFIVDSGAEANACSAMEQIIDKVAEGYTGRLVFEWGSRKKTPADHTTDDPLSLIAAQGRISLATKRGGIRLRLRNSSPLIDKYKSIFEYADPYSVETEDEESTEQLA